MPVEFINDVNLYYEITGRGKETIAFLNGVGMTVKSWQPFSQLFESEFKCLFHDFRGQLLSSHGEKEFSMELHVEDFTILLDKLNIDKIHVIGTSYGSEVAMIFAYTYPERIKSLTVIDGLSETDELTRNIVQTWILGAKSDVEAFFRSLVPWTYSNTFLSKNPNFVENRIKDVGHLLKKDFFSGFVKLCQSFLKLNITDKLADIRCPAMVITGEKDLIKPVKFGKIISEKIQDSKFIVLADTGHGAVIERPDSLYSIVKDFINEKK